MDVWGPYKVQTFDGNNYFLTIVDYFTRMTWLYLLKMKFDMCVVIPTFLHYVKTQFNKTIKTIRSENGTEFLNDT